MRLFVADIGPIGLGGYKPDRLRSKIVEVINIIREQHDIFYTIKGDDGLWSSKRFLTMEQLVELACDDN